MAENKIAVNQTTLTLPISQIGEKFGLLRLISPSADKAILRSMEKYGQLAPVVVNQAPEKGYELLDGFKRLRASRKLTIENLNARVIHLGIHASKAAIMQLNWVGKTINHMEEALVTHSLYHENGLTQVEIAMLLGRHKSWASRRISLVERLSDEVQEHIRLGLISVSIGMELSKLRRHNQETVLKTIRKYGLTVRQTRKLVWFLLASPKWNHDSILKNPWELFEDNGVPIRTKKPDEKLSSPAMAFKRKLVSMEKGCLSVLDVATDSELAPLSEEDLLNIGSISMRVIETAERAIEQLQKTILSKPLF